MSIKVLTRGGKPLLSKGKVAVTAEDGKTCGTCCTGGGGTCGPHDPTSFSFSATGSVPATPPAFTCSSSASASNSGAVTPPFVDFCTMNQQFFPVTHYSCPASCTFDHPSFAGTELFFSLSYTTSYRLNMRGAMFAMSPVTGCGVDNCNGSVVTPAEIDLLQNPLGVHTFNFNDGISFFTFNITFS